MNPGIISLLMVAFLLSGCSTSSYSAKKDKAAAEFEHTAALIESGSYMFTIRSASPSGGKTIQITSQYALKALEGTYEAYLPYFGRAYSAGYGDSGGIEFKGEAENLEISRNDKKLNISVSFSIGAENDTYTVNLKVGSSGYGQMTVSSQKRQAITYSGKAGELKDQ